MPRVEVRLLKNLDEYTQCEVIQSHIWGGPGITREVLSVTQKYGGAMVGTLVGGKVVGFIYAFLARYHGRLVHWSHLMAVEAKYRDQGFGFRMKLVHRKVALERGIKSICWTFDPLQSRNARLNISRLGALADEYVPDCYGRFPSLLEKGLPSDRWVANWRIATARVEERLRGEAPPFNPSTPRVNETRLNAQGFPQNRAIRLDLTASPLAGGNSHSNRRDAVTGHAAGPPLAAGSAPHLSTLPRRGISRGGFLPTPTGHRGALLLCAAMPRKRQLQV